MQKPGKNILFLCDYQAPYGGNFIACMLELDAALKKYGVQTFYVFPKGARDRFWMKNMQERNIDVSFLPDGGLLHKAFFLLNQIRGNRIRILHVHFGFFPLAELTALLCPDIGLVLHFHSDFSAGKPMGMKARIHRKVKIIPELLIGSRRLVKITVSEGSARTEPDCVSVRNALVPDRLAPEYKTGKEVREEYSIPDTAKLLLVFGWAPYIKGVDLAAEAVSLLRQSTGQDIRLGIIFGRTCREPEIRSFLRENTFLTGSEEWLVMLPPEEDVFRYHHAADVMLSPSRSETFSYALLEAVYSGKPVAASDIPGQQWAKQFETVFFCPYESVDGLEQAVLQALSADQASLCRSQLTAESEYGVQNWKEGIFAVYRRFLAL